VLAVAPIGIESLSRATKHRAKKFCRQLHEAPTRPDVRRSHAPSFGSVVRWQEANSHILKAISDKGVRAALFVCGMRVDEADGAKLLSAWIRQATSSAIIPTPISSMERKTSYADYAVDF